MRFSPSTLSAGGTGSASEITGSGTGGARRGASADDAGTAGVWSMVCVGEPHAGRLARAARAARQASARLGGMGRV